MEDSAAITLKNHQLYVVTGKTINVEEEKAKLEEELEYTKGFLQSVQKKLANKGFVNNAPTAVVAKEEQKKADAEATIEALQKRLQEL